MAKTVAEIKRAVAEINRDLETGAENRERAHQTILDEFVKDLNKWEEEARPFDRDMAIRILEVLIQFHELEMDESRHGKEAEESVKRLYGKAEE